MSNLYLEGTIKGLELLKTVEKKHIDRRCMRCIPDKETAWKNVNELKPFFPKVGYSMPQEYITVASGVMTDNKVVFTLNSLCKEEDTIDMQCISVFGKYLKKGWEYVPDTMARALKEHAKVANSYSYCETDNTVIELRIMYEFLRTGHEDIVERIVKYYNKEVIRLFAKAASRQDDFSSYMERYFILEKLPEGFDLSLEAQRIDKFLEILNQPGVLDIYKLAGDYSDSLSFKDVRDYSRTASIIEKTVEKISTVIDEADQNDGEDQKGYLLDRYFSKATNINFDEKLLSGYLKNIEGFNKEQISESLILQASFIAVCTGNRYTALVSRIRNESGLAALADLALRAITGHKKAFLRLMENSLELFVSLPSDSILFNEASFSDHCNVNTLTEKDIRTLLKKEDDGSFVYTDRKVSYKYMTGNYTFQEFITLCTKKDWIKDVYGQLDENLCIDEKLRRIRQLFHEDIGTYYLSEEDSAVAAKALSRESFEDYCRRIAVTGCTKKEMFRLMVMEEKDARYSFLSKEVKTALDVSVILHNADRPELFDLGLTEFKKSFTELDKNSKWLKEAIDIPEEHKKRFEKFCLEGNADITYDYYRDNNYNEEQAQNVLLLAKAAIYGRLDEVKYMNFQEEIGYPVSDDLENAWKKNISIEIGKIKTAEYTDFQSCMVIGEKPARTCMNYKDGDYNECLLSTFDANKKILYVTENGTIIGRAILRLTKASDQKNSKSASLLHFADVGKNDDSSEENLILFLEKYYSNGFTGAKEQMILNSLYELAKKKADEMNLELVLASDYEKINNNNRFYRKQSCIYVSKSKNGKQYLDSLGGDCDKGGYYVSGNFYFVS